MERVLINKLIYLKLIISNILTTIPFKLKLGLVWRMSSAIWGAQCPENKYELH